MENKLMDMEVEMGGGMHKNCMKTKFSHENASDPLPKRVVIKSCVFE